MSVVVKPGLNCFFSRVQNAGTQCLQIHDLIPSSFKTGRHSHWWSSTLHLMHLWAHLHRPSLFGICTSKGESFWINLSSLANNSLASGLAVSLSTYSWLLQPNQLQWGSSLACMLTHHNVGGNHGHRDCHVALVLRCIQQHSNVDPFIGCCIVHLLLHNKGDANQR